MNREQFHRCAQESFRSYPCSFTVHLTKGPGPLLWQNALTLLYSILRNRYLKRSLSNRTLGHVTIELNRQGRAPLMIGQALRDMQLFRQHLLTGRGIDLLFRPDHLQRYPELVEVAQLITVDGHLEQPEELEAEYAGNTMKPDMMSFATYLVNEQTMERMEQFFHQYREVTEKTQHEKVPKAGNRYGFGADPLKFEGAGCATLTRAFFQLAGLDHHYQEVCHRHLHLAKTHIKKADQKKISDLFNISLRPSKKKQKGIAGADRSDEILVIDIPDPALFHDRIHQYVVHREDVKSDHPSSSFGTFFGLPVMRAERWNGTPSRHLVLDARSIKI